MIRTIIHDFNLPNETCIPCNCSNSENIYIDTKVMTKYIELYGIGRTLSIKHVIFNPPATIVFWNDGSKTVVKCGKNETFDKEKGVAMAISKRAYGNTGSYYNLFKKFCHENEENVPQLPNNEGIV